MVKTTLPEEKRSRQKLTAALTHAISAPCAVPIEKDTSILKSDIWNLMMLSREKLSRMKQLTNQLNSSPLLEDLQDKVDHQNTMVNGRLLLTIKSQIMCQKH